MKYEVDKRLRFLIFLVALLISLPAPASLVRIEGSAGVTIVFASQDIVICHKRVSGESSPELFALDPKAKKVLWRVSPAYTSTDAVLDGSGNFVLVEGVDKLVCRNLKTGQIVWKTKMSAIRPLESDWREGERGTSLPGEVRLESYEYKGPFVRDSELLLFRKAYSRPDYRRYLFSDWLLFDSKNGRLLRKGRGEYVGASERSFLLKNSWKGPLFILQEKELSEIPITPEDLEQRRRFDRMDTFYFESHDFKYSCQERCVISVGSPHNEICIFDVNSREFTYISPTSYPRHYADWVLLQNHILRYSRQKFIHWLEVYDLKGQLVSTEKLIKAGNSKGDWLEFVGTTSNDNVVFSRGDRLLVFEVPSLRIVADNYLGKRLPRDTNILPGPDFFPLRNSDIVYEMFGNISFKRMRTKELPHEICVNLIDCHTGKRIWGYCEQVIITRFEQ
jgi:hypothetical protein